MEGRLGSVMCHFGYKGDLVLGQKTWSERSSTQVPRAGFRVLAPVSGSNIFLRSGTNLGKFDCQMGFPLETGQEMVFFSYFVWVKGLLAQVA